MKGIDLTDEERGDLRVGACLFRVPPYDKNPQSQRIADLMERLGGRPNQPQGEASPQGAMLDAENAEGTTASSGPHVEALTELVHAERAIGAAELRNIGAFKARLDRAWEAAFALVDGRIGRE